MRLHHPDKSGFAMTRVVGSIPSDATDHVTYSMDNNSSGFPTGTATIK